MSGALSSLTPNTYPIPIAYADLLQDLTPSEWMILFILIRKIIGEQKPSVKIREIIEASRILKCRSLKEPLDTLLNAGLVTIVSCDEEASSVLQYSNETRVTLQYDEARMSLDCLRRRREPEEDHDNNATL